ncbi:unnamed protein product [Polarella glacialis]|uniref:CBS domain-containing protein n=1 Tax=Polarella glacialis TaxID=89957 RepID=A0A813D3M5_POLGL|nr:unnamed protein product [Polarella glacialis]
MADPAADGWPVGKVFDAAPNGYTYDDLVFMPGFPSFEASAVETTSQLTRNITLKCPIVGAPNDTVTEADMAIALALAGGIGIIHPNQSIESQVQMVNRVKRYVNGFILDPITLGPKETLEDLDRLRAATGICSAPITDDGQLTGKLIGFISARDSDTVQDRRTPLSQCMVTKVVTAKEPLTLEEARAQLKLARVGKLPILDASENRLVSMVARSDLKKERDYPNMSRDISGKLLVGAAIPEPPNGGATGQDDWERASALAAAGADVIYLMGGAVDSNLELIQKIKASYPVADVLAGPAATCRAARRLAEAGADGIVAGSISGSDAGGDPYQAPVPAAVGRGESSTVYEVSHYSRQNFDLPITAGGGVRSAGHALLAMGLGASCVMLAEQLAGCEEAPAGGGASLALHHNHSAGAPLAVRGGYRSSGSPEVVLRTVGHPVPHKGSVKAFIPYMMSGVRKSLGDLGCQNLHELHSGIDNETLRMECRSTFSAQVRDACAHASKHARHPEVIPVSMSAKSH